MLVYVDSFGASAYVMNVTVTDPTTAGFVTVFPFPGDLPLASNLNFVAGQTVPNLVYTAAGPDVAFFNLAGNTHIVVDLFGMFT
jgi:serine protease